MPPSIPLSKKIAATTVKTKKSVKKNDAYHDPRFNKLKKLHTGYKTLSMVAKKVISAAGEVLGV
ncbi:hypothetical protein TRFO_33843 [Tritrichomonas foetus]|uniref:Uncharacterized protein n=1 Tax=Tritrichomonas foetus TaxID=1144522 RepID=A0A1J4JKR1_9EUKA|nr:hypothetical protein TRFO_33843 [Tritrichomonas foetus]|eukprot:OHS99712.1 hypothetical protein TRFO_33843 [Tritrichomonas foetus]